MSDDDMSDNDQPPALEDADIDDVSSGASVVTESSDSVSIDTEDESSGRRGGRNDLETMLMEEDDSSNDSEDDFPEPQRNSEEGTLGAAFTVPLKTGSGDEGEEDNEPKALPAVHRMRRRRSVEERNEILERNSMRRQASNDMLAAMRAAAMASNTEDTEETSSGPPRRAPPARTKSGDGLNGSSLDAAEDENGTCRRPPPRTKSGDGLGGGDAPPRRRAPARTKSGDGFATSGEVRPVRREPSGPGNLTPEDSGDFVAPLRGDSDDDDELLMSPSGRRRRTTRERDEALSRNAVRRQASSDMLRVMRDSAKRAPPARAKSSAATLQRRAPARTKSGDGLEGGEAERPAPRRRPPPRTKSGDAYQEGGEAERPAPRRRPPPRTKSGDGLGADGGGAPRRRAPARTKSGSVFAPTAIVEE